MRLIEGIRQGLARPAVSGAARGRRVLVAGALARQRVRVLRWGSRRSASPVDLLGALLLQGMLVLGISVQLTPGYVGQFEAAIVAALALYGVPNDVASSYAIAYPRRDLPPDHPAGRLVAGPHPSRPGRSPTTYSTAVTPDLSRKKRDRRCLMTGASGSTGGQGNAPPLTEGLWSAPSLGVRNDVRDGALDGLPALVGKCFCERALVINLSGPFEDVSGKRLMFSRGA